MFIYNFDTSKTVVIVFTIATVLEVLSFLVALC